MYNLLCPSALLWCQPQARTRYSLSAGLLLWCSSCPFSVGSRVPSSPPGLQVRPQNLLGCKSFLLWGEGAPVSWMRQPSLHGEVLTCTGWCFSQTTLWPWISYALFRLEKSKSSFWLFRFSFFYLNAIKRCTVFKYFICWEFIYLQRKSKFFQTPDLVIKKCVTPVPIPC